MKFLIVDAGHNLYEMDGVSMEQINEYMKMSIERDSLPKVDFGNGLVLTLYDNKEVIVDGKNGKAKLSPRAVALYDFIGGSRMMDVSNTSEEEQREHKNLLDYAVKTFHRLYPKKSKVLL